MLNIKAVSEHVRIKETGQYDLGSVLRLSGARGEKVFGQVLLITDLKEYVNEIKIHAFKNEGKIEEIDAQIFWEYFVNIKKPSCSYGGTGKYPEVLIPAEYIVKTAHATIEPDKNRALLISVSLPKNAEKGKYFSCMEVICKNSKIQIPIELTVYDFSLPEQNHSRTAFAIFFKNYSYKNKTEFPCHDLFDEYKSTYDLLKSFRVSAAEIPVRSAERPEYCACWGNFTCAYEPHRGIAETDLDNFVAAAKKYTEDPEVSAYALPYRSYTDENGITRIDISFETKVLAALANASIKNVDLLKKAYFYATFADEPTKELFPCVRAVKEDFRQAVRTVADTCDFSGKENVKVSLLSIDNIVTAWPDEKLYGGVDTWCPNFSGFAAPELRYEMKKLGDLGSKFWWYGCMVPHYPYPSYHIDEPLLSARLEGILRYRYGARGNLYWAVNMHTKYNGESKAYEEVDPYEETMSWENANGDGVLVYNGERFGYRGLLPSLRLAAICEGNQDYEYCLLLENAIEKLNKKYKARIDPVDYLRPIWDKIHYGTICLAGGYDFASIRRELADSIVAAERGIMADIAEVDAKTQTARINVYSPANCSISCSAMNGKTKKSGSGKVTEFQIKLNEKENTYCEIGIEDSDGSFLYKRLVSPPVRYIAPAQWTAVNTSETSVKGGKLYVETDRFTDGDLNPKLTAKGNFDLSDLDSFMLQVNSYSRKPFLLSVSVTDANGKKFVLGYEIFETGEKNARVYFHPRLQLKPGFQDYCYTESAFYTEEKAERNAINLQHIVEISVEVRNPRLVNEINSKGVLPREFSVDPYNFDVEIYYTEWAGKSPHKAYFQQ